MKGALAEAADAIGGQVVSVALSLAAVGIVGYIVYQKFFSPSGVVTAAVANTVQATADVVSGLPGLISDTLTGTNASTYITADQQKAAAAAALAAHNASLTVGA